MKEQKDQLKLLIFGFTVLSQFAVTVWFFAQLRNDVTNNAERIKQVADEQASRRVLIERFLIVEERLSVLNERVGSFENRVNRFEEHRRTERGRN